MVQVRRVRFSAGEKAQLWARWKAGESLSDIGRALGKHAGSIHGVVAACGGIAPAERRRSRLALTPSEREEISRGLAAGVSIRQIAKTLDRAPSTISRELARHGTRHTYRATVANERAWDRARRPKPCRLATYVPLQQLVGEKLAVDWSPQQIAGWLRVQYPGTSDMHISHETIYRSLFIQARGVLKKELVKHLRSRRMMRRSRWRAQKGNRASRSSTPSRSANAHRK